MNIALLPDDKEFNFRNVHYKNVLDILDGDIWCAICNLDLKKNIIINEKILVHEMFLCICCKDCFEKLSNLQNGCILCSENIQLKSCKICNSNMCQRCVVKYCSKSKKLKKLKGCLRCSTKEIWTQRSQAAAVLKCFSFELNSRLKLSGEESEDKQCLQKFIINTAECDNNILPNDMLYIRMKYLYNLLNSKINLAMDDYQKAVQNKDIKQCVEQFSKLCEQVLISTCEILEDFKCFFNEEIIESLNRKVKSILKNSILFNNIEYGCNGPLEDSCTSYNALNSTISGLIDHKSPNASTSNSNVSLEAQDRKIINQHLSNMADISTSKKIIVEKTGAADRNISSNELNEVSNQKNLKLNNTPGILGNSKDMKICSVKLDENVADKIEQKFVGKSSHLNTKCSNKMYLVSKGITKNLTICLTRCDQETINKNNEKKSNKELVGESSHLNIESNKKMYLASKGITKNITICLTRFDQRNTDNNNEIKSKEKLAVGKVHLNTEPSENINFVSEEAMMWGGPKIYLTRCDQMNIDNNYELKSEEESVGEKVHINTESSDNMDFVSEDEMMPVPKMYLTRFDQMNIDNYNKIKSTEEFVGESSHINTESRKLASVGNFKDSVIDLTRFDEESIENGIQIESDDELSTISTSKIVHKNNKSSKENILKNVTNSDPFKESNVIFKMIDEDTIICKMSPTKKENQNCSEENADSKSNKNIRKRMCQEDSSATKKLKETIQINIT